MIIELNTYCRYCRRNRIYTEEQIPEPYRKIFNRVEGG